MLLLEKVGVPLCLSVSKRPCFERKTRRYTNVVGCSVKILHSEAFPGSSAVFVLFSVGFVSWSGVFSFLLQVSLFLQFKRIIPAPRCLRHVRRAPPGTCGASAVRRCSPLSPIIPT